MRMPKITRLQVLETALTLLETEGIEGLTMRKLADAIGIKAASLYWHFSNKQALLEGMADHIVATVAINFQYKQDWKANLITLTSQLRDALLQHRDGARVFAGTYVISDNVLRINNALIKTFVQSGVSANQAASSTMTVFYFILGCCIEQQAAIFSADSDLINKESEFNQLSQDKFPYTWEAKEMLFSNNYDQRFIDGLNLIINGLEKISTKG
ncbi:TetR/AcrR family transcriptional regulator C-terminal domain-containing protein [Providencia rettgeri]|uniref:TetR/AcrR family transcriptional regulator C-terminal domain-containing protein n=1 Tax=Providencia TaxID=586 RepID=UPI0005B34635|nr:TetR/AcrR family transcriptional regulator C-terminal domain-containing protein [Providencia rettgeri]EJD6043603.1 TetR/AcrR family transcriptional regulator C-terminal domain-containing protein [Providencia rettgeri]EJD6539892.1 TetR/AcrR family transcriptional regulator C-terminal domain-containing protein [Providencia rettgeri]EJD6671777.1 TetR/AcrR family transcriptional regulator C-terminal domain-containing protein [Providencia rettgeri]ELQ1456894.1 TetR/AcrR family transcriptional reg